MCVGNLERRSKRTFDSVRPTILGRNDNVSVRLYQAKDPFKLIFLCSIFTSQD